MYTSAPSAENHTDDEKSHESRRPCQYRPNRPGHPGELEPRLEPGERPPHLRVGGEPLGGAVERLVGDGRGHADGE